MKPKLLATAALAGLIAALACGASSPVAAKPGVPRGFFGIGPQAAVSERDAEYMAAGGIESIRAQLTWGAVQPTRNGGYLWDEFDQVVATAARQGIAVLPFVIGTPRWLASDWRRLPVGNGRQRSAWRAFLRAAVQRYGPRGSFWREHSRRSAEPLPKTPIRVWQIWNEVNFFYFAKPISPGRYAQLVSISGPAVKSADGGATVLLSGLFGEPEVGRRRGMDATEFLAALYRWRGIARRFDGVALHPYAVDARDLERMVEEIYEVGRENRDRPQLYVTELGWGSENNFRQVAFEQGLRGQARQLRASYEYMLENQRRLNLKGAYWFSWKDLEGSCNFCDSVGLFREGEGFRPKPAWRAFLRFSGGRARP